MSNKEVSIGVKLVADLRSYQTELEKGKALNAQFGQNVQQKVLPPLKQMQKELNDLKWKQSKSLTTEQWQKYQREIEATQRKMSDFKGPQGLGGTNDVVSKLIGTAKGLLPAFGFGAIAAGAAYAFTQVVASTDTLSTKWAIFTGGLREGMNQFWRTIATGDWSNFIDNMEKAITTGRRYQEMLDEIEAKQRSLSVTEANAQGKALELEQKLRNKTLSKAERLAAGQDRIKLEEDLAAARTKVAQESFDAEIVMATNATKLTREQLMALIADMDSPLKQQAEAYNKIYESYRKSGFTDKEIASSKVIGAEFTADAKNYAASLRLLGNATDESLNKLVEAFSNLKQAENSAVENTMRVRTQVNTLLAETSGSPVITLNELQAKQIKTYAELTEQINQYKTLLQSTDITNTQQIATIYREIAALEAKKKALEALATPAVPRDNTAMPSAAPKSGTIAIGSATPGLMAWDNTKFNDITDEQKEKLLQLQETAKEVGGTISSVFEEMGNNIVDSMGLAETGWGGFVKSLYKGITKIVSMLMANAISHAIVGGEQASLATGPAAPFTAPMFIAEAIGVVMAAFSKIPKFAAGESVFYGNNIVRVGEYANARVNPELIGRKDQFNKIIGDMFAQHGGSGVNITLAPAVEWDGRKMRIGLRQVDNTINGVR